MESKKVKSGGVQNPKRKRSLDVRSFCESRFSKVEGNKRKVFGGNVDQEDTKKKKKKKKIRTGAPLSSYESDSKKSRNKDSGNEMSKGLHGISSDLGGNISLFNIPKRPRGSVGRKKVESQGCQRSSSSVDKDGPKPNDLLVSSASLSVDNDAISSSRLVEKLVGSSTKSTQKADSKSTMDSRPSNVKLKRKKKINVVKENNLVSNCLGTPNSRNKKDFLVVGTDCIEASIRKPEPSVGSAVSNSLFTDDEDDEENLEQNAARMLSSRFDPSCTGFSSKINSSVSWTADDLSFQVSSGSGDDSRRTLRPRRADKGKDLSKNRRHFYDVCGRDLDPYWVLKRRIKIFWPLDDSWYDGVVNDYHLKTKLHHIKYDDRDEEWVNLEEEKIKLLLLRSEIPGRVKFRKRSTEVKDTHADDDISIGNSLESEPIALWIASQSQRVKSLLKSPKRQKSSQNHLPLASSFSSEKTDIPEDVLVDDSEITKNKPRCKSSLANSPLACGTVDKPLPGVICQSDKHLVYIRKKIPKKSVGISSLLQMWSFDDKRKSSLNDVFMESKELRIQIYLPILPYLEFLCGIGCFRMVHDMFMLKRGVIMTTSPAVLLEMLFVDNNLGLRLLLFEGCLQQALAIVFQILFFFSQSDENSMSNSKLPVTSIRFQLSSVNDLWKQHVFAVHHFSKLQSSKWLYLETKVLQQCLLIKQLSYSECTYENIKELECGVLHPCKPRVGLELSSNEYFKKKPDLGIFPKDISLEACNTRMSHSGIFSQLPTFFPKLHLQSLVEHSFARANLQHQNATRSQETSENVGQPVVECSSLDIPTEHEARHLDADPPASRSLSIYQRTDVSILDSNTMRSKSSSKRGRSNPISVGNPVFMPNGFSNGPKKPRTQVQYSLPFAGYDLTRNQDIPISGSLPCKRIRRASLRRISDDSGNNQKNLDSLTCFANVLVTNEEKGWRECGVNILLEAASDNEWRLAVKLSGLTRFLYKVKHILQLGSTNRYSHAMIWKGGKDWILEFPDRTQWMVFKEMYEECYNRNIRAASVKNIPIPGVSLVEETQGYGDEVSFVRNSKMYFRQVQTDVEMAVDPTRVLYDMDSDDERWLKAHKYEEITDMFLEKSMDMFEKVSYARGRDHFTDAEVEELAIGVGSVEASKLVYQHWRQKREKMCMPLIRHLQPPTWERYQRQLKEWEHNAARGNCAVLVGDHEKEKPPMFAFCLKPLGLDVPNNGSKHRSHRRFSVSGNHHAFSMDRDSLLVYGRRRNVHAFADVSQDARFKLSTKWKVNHKVYKNNKHKTKLKSNPYFHIQRSTSNAHRSPGNQNGSHQWNKLKQQMDTLSLDEFHLKEALGAAKHAHEIAKFKKERAQSLLYRADLAINKAVSTLMNAEAMKDSSNDSNGLN